MDQLKLKYIIELVSNVGPAAQRDGKALIDAQKKVQEALADSNKQIGWMERALLKMGRVGSESAGRQADYLTKLALKYHDVRRAADSAVTSMTKAARVGAQVAAGAAAGTYAADRVTKAPMAYESKLAAMANTAFNDRKTPQGRRDGAAMLDAVIRTAVRQGGGTKDAAADALADLLATGNMTQAQALMLLPRLTKGATAGNSTPVALGRIAGAAIANLGVTADQAGNLLNEALVAGQAGGFELRNMESKLPTTLALGANAGLLGEEGFRAIVAGLQASLRTAGTPDAAANNMDNLLAKIPSEDTARDFKKLGYNLPDELARFKKMGVNQLDAFVEFTDQIVSKDPRYQKALAAYNSAKNKGDQTLVEQSIKGIFEGAGIGSVVQDRQALMALLALRNNRKYVQDIQSRMKTGAGETDVSFAMMAGTSEFKKEQFAQEASFAADTAFAKVAPALNKVFDTSTDLAREFPTLTAAAGGAAGALTVLAAAAGASGLAGLLMGGGLGGAGGAVAGAAKFAAKGGLVGVAYATGYGVGSVIYDKGLKSNGAGDALGRGIANVMAFFGSSDAAGSLDVERRADADMRQARNPNRGRGYRDPRLLSMTGPGAGAAAAAEAISAVDRAALGEGVIRIEVSAKDGSMATVQGVQNMPGFRLNPGNTNPAGY